jgi:uncharacterized protein (DUF111 family)
MRILFIDAFSGLSGDKLVSSLYDALGSYQDLNEIFKDCPIETEFSLSFSETSVNGMQCKRFNVTLIDKSTHHHHHHHHHHHVHHENEHGSDTHNHKY